MIDLKLTDIQWMDPGLAGRLESEGVTVESMAAASPEEFLKVHPYVGTINAWLLTSEAAYLMNAVGAGEYEPARIEQARVIQSLERMATVQYQKKPEMQWPPPPRPPKQYSARIKRIRRAQGLPVDEG